MQDSNDPHSETNTPNWAEVLKEHARTGEPLDLAPDKEIDWVDAANWGPHRTIPAAALREVVTDKQLRVNPRGLRIRGALFSEALNLGYAAFPYPLELLQCGFMAGLFLDRATLWELDLSGSRTRSISMIDTHMTGSLLAKGLTSGPILAASAKIDGHLSLMGADLNGSGSAALNIQGAYIGGGLFAESFNVVGPIYAGWAKIDGHLVLNGAKLNNPNGVALEFSSAEVGGGVQAASLRATGQINAQGAKIDGHLSLKGADLNNIGGACLDIQGIHLGGYFVADEFKAVGQVHAARAQIDGPLVLSRAKLDNRNDVALNLSSATIGGDMLADGLETVGQIYASGAKIDGLFALNHAKLENPDGVALDISSSASGAVTAEDIYTAGQIRALGAKVAGPISLRRADLNKPGDVVLDLEAAHISGSMFVENGCRTVGEIRMLGAKIDGQLALNDAYLENQNDVALNFSSAEIGIDVSAVGLEAVGKIRATGVKVDGAVILREAKLCAADGIALDLAAANIGATLSAYELESVGTVRVAGAKIGLQLILRDAELRADRGDALDLSAVEIGEDLLAEGLTVVGRIVAPAAKIGQSFALNRADLRADEGYVLNLAGASVAGGISLCEGFSAVGGVNATGAKIGVKLDLTEAKLHNPDDIALALTLADVSGAVIASKGFQAVGQVDATGATIDSGLYLIGGKVGKLSATGAKIGSGIVLNGSEVRGGVQLDRAHIAGGLFAEQAFSAHGGINAQDATIEGKLGLQRAKLDNPDGDALNLQGARITHGVFANVQFEATGGIDAPEATIGGGIYLDGAKLTNTGKQALRLNGADVRGDLLADGMIVKGEISAARAKIGGQLSLTSANVNNTGGNALVLTDAQIAGGIFADRLHATGRVAASGAIIGVQLGLKGAELDNPRGDDPNEKDALFLDSAQIHGTVFVCEKFKATGQIRAVAARIDGQLDMRDSTIDAPFGSPLLIDRSYVGGGIEARQDEETGTRLTTRGRVTAMGATIEGTSHLDGAHLINPGGYALRLDTANITGNIYARNGFHAEGELRAVSAKINGEVDFTTAALHNSRDDCALNLEGAQVGHLKLNDLQLVGRLNLKRARIQTLETTRPTPKPLLATGWEITDLHGRLRDDRATAQDWLNSTPEKPTSVQPWHELADVYERNGEPSAAKRLRFAAANKLTCQSPRRTMVLRGAYFLVLGNGYYPLFTAIWLAFVVALGIWIVANHRDDIVPLRPEDAQTAINDYANLHPAGLPVAAPQSAPAGTPANNTQQDQAFETDLYGFTDYPAARCGEKAIAVLLLRTDESLTAVCHSTGGSLYYKGTRLEDQVSIEINNVTLTANGYTAIDASDGTRYEATPRSLTITENNKPATTEPAVQSAIPRITAATPCDWHYPGYPCMASWVFTLGTILPLASTTTRTDWAVASDATHLLTVALPVLKLIAWALAALFLAGVTGLLRKT